jgi:hypothetical protein
MHRTLTLLAALLLLAGPAAAAPRSIADCEAIQAADAYNQCLASFGPMRGQHGANYPGMASEPDRGGGSHGAARRQGPGFGRGFGAGVAVSHGRGGRVRMEFTPGRGGR